MSSAFRHEAGTFRRKKREALQRVYFSRTITKLFMLPAFEPDY